MILELALVFIFSLCIGSFLNVVGHRLITEENLLGRSHCPHCKAQIAWYDNIPLISYLFLQGKCRACRAAISPLYPFIELVTGMIGLGLWLQMRLPLLFAGASWSTAVAYQSHVSIQELSSFIFYALFFAALIVAVRTDLEDLVISQLCTLWMIPVGVASTFTPQAIITWKQSIAGVVVGYGALWLIAFLFRKLTGKEGMGEGDIELLAMIGSFVGPLGVWAIVMVGSIAGLIIGGVYLLFKKEGFGAKLPFGPFLALGAAVYFFFGEQLLALVLLI